MTVKGTSWDEQELIGYWVDGADAKSDDTRQKIQDKLKEFDEKFISAFFFDWGRPIKAVDGIKKMELIKDFLQKALEDIYRQGKEDGVRGFVEFMKSNDSFIDDQRYFDEWLEEYLSQREKEE